MRHMPKSVVFAITTMTALTACSLLSVPVQAQETEKAAAPLQKTNAEEVELKTPTGTLYGTLLLPAAAPSADKPVPVVLIHAGSGPTDRDGNSPLLPGANDSLKQLAQGLAAQGIASLRFDKRGIAKSAAAIIKEEDLRFDNYIDDAVAWGKWLKADKRFSKLTIAGHSEGSLIGMVAARRLPADAYVSIAGVGEPTQEVLLTQLRAQLPPALLAKSEAAIHKLSAGETVKDTPPELAALFRPSVQPYIISWFKYDAGKEIAKLTIPVLITQGTNDVQVAVKEANLLAKAKPDAKLVLVKDMNHVLKIVPAGDNAAQKRSYGDSAMPVAPELVKAIADFVNGK
jgi:pimeloyl-ACP methyl ester carboxylesterase